MMPAGSRATPVPREAPTNRSAFGTDGLPLGAQLRGKRFLRGLDIDQRVGFKMHGDDIRPFIQDTVQRIVALNIEHGDGAASYAGIDVPADPALLIPADPRPKRLARARQLGWSLGARR